MPDKVVNPCHPSPCGPFSICQEQNGVAICSCQETYLGSPPSCRAECVTNSECTLDRTCINRRCVDPCPGSCAPSATCKVFNHNVFCTCPPDQTGNPFYGCTPLPPPRPEQKQDPCLSANCGPFSQCRVINEQGVCSCLPNYFGQPPYCKPECVVSPDCPYDRSCVNEKCRDPCVGMCGYNADCRTVNHNPNW